MAETGPRVFIVAGEDSGDLHAANLIRRMQEIRPDIAFEGFGGERMEAAGCLLHENILHLAGMGVSFMGDIAAFLRLLRKFYVLIDSRRPSALVLVDYPGFNFLLARLARYFGVPVVYYICPQIWAWAPWRRRKILGLTDLLMVILPFEEEFYRNPEREVVYVGHPLADALVEQPPADQLAAGLRQSFGVPGDTRIIGLFPGSRSHEAAHLLPFFRRALEKMALDGSSHRVMVSCCRDDFRPLIEQAFAGSGFSVSIVQGDAHPLMAACRFAFVASGTAALELAYYQTPMVVLYRLSRVSYLGFRLLCTSPFISLVNILGGEEVVPEDIDYRDTTDEQARRARELYEDTPIRVRCLERLAELKAKAFRTGGTLRAAETLARFLARNAP